jgi:hypothetical protein
VNTVYGCCARQVFVNRPPLAEKVPRIAGDSDLDTQNVLHSTTSIEFRDPMTN